MVVLEFAAISHDLQTLITRMKICAQFVKDSITWTKWKKMINEMVAFVRDVSGEQSKLRFSFCCFNRIRPIGKS